MFLPGKFKAGFEPKSKMFVFICCQTILEIPMKLIYKILIVFSLFIAVQTLANAQSVPPPPPPVHGQSGNSPPGGGAPVGAGAGFLLLMSAGYGAKKIYDQRQRLEE